MTLDEFLEDFKKTLDEPLHNFEAAYKVENLTDPEANPMTMEKEKWISKFLPYFFMMTAQKLMDD